MEGIKNRLKMYTKSMLSVEEMKTFNETLVLHHSLLLLHHLFRKWQPSVGTVIRRRTSSDIFSEIIREDIFIESFLLNA